MNTQLRKWMFAWCLVLLCCSTTLLAQPTPPCEEPDPEVNPGMLQDCGTDTGTFGTPTTTTLCDATSSLTVPNLTDTFNNENAPGWELEYVVTDACGPLAGTAPNDGPPILGGDADGTFIPADFGLADGSQFCVTAINYDLQAVQDEIQALFTGSSAIGDCCSTVESALGVDVCATLCPTGTYGTPGSGGPGEICGGADITGFEQLNDVIVALGGSASVETVVDLIVNTLNPLGNQAGIGDCGDGLPICFALSTNDICYEIDSSDPSCATCPTFTSVDNAPPANITCSGSSMVSVLTSDNASSDLVFNWTITGGNAAATITGANTATATITYDNQSCLPVDVEVSVEVTCTLTGSSTVFSGVAGTTTVSPCITCDDNDVCNGLETCDAAGTCQAGTPLVCDDGNVCNGLETCDAVNGCQAGTPLVCDDGDACNGVETCDPVAGCQAGTPLVCDDGDMCNGTETCDATNGCQAGTPLVCDDNDVCNGMETCDAMLGCQAGTPLVCDDGNPCNGVETCDPIAGCQAGTPLVCDDGNPCNGVETCDPVAGCQPGTAPTCGDGVCDVACGEDFSTCPGDCSCTSDADCGDGDVCNGIETCDATGTCQPGTPLVCDDGDVCNGVETCDPVNGCQAGTPLVCDDGDACNGVETCDPIAGCQSGTALVCDDGDVCNGLETCDATNGCQSGTPLVCDDNDPCNGVETCDPVAGCQSDPTFNSCGNGVCDCGEDNSTCPGDCPSICTSDAQCDDGNVCNGLETCDATGNCQPGTPLVCDDNDVCNGLETCDATNGCQAGTPLSCDDNDVCNGLETCDAISGCQSGTPLVCDDGDPCNGVETCDPVAGCQSDPTFNSCGNGVCDCGEDNSTCPADCPTTGCTNAGCDDGDVCNGMETCDAAGMCQSGTPLVCDDNDVCNGLETCDPTLGCVAGTPLVCDDGDMCNGVETCDPVAGCQAGTPLNCDDGNVCNGTETCDVTAGCIAGTPLNCDNGDVCDGIETCDPTFGCLVGTPLNCDDGNPCNGVETCDPVLGCQPDITFNSCGNGVCDCGETSTTCPQDCTVVGCTDANADNYDPAANSDDGSCAYSGCDDPTAINYDPTATVNDGSCVYNPPGCGISAIVTLNQTIGGGFNVFYYDRYDIDIVGGTLPYDYNFSNSGYARFGITGLGEARVLAADNASWSLTITDANGCATIVNEDSFNGGNLGFTSLDIVSYTITPASGGAFILANNGAIDIAVGGGVPGYTYNWSGPMGFSATSQDVAGLVPGWYAVTVCDSQVPPDCTTRWFWVPYLQSRGKIQNISNGVSVYPNPFSEQTTVEFSTAQTAKVSVDVFNLAGVQVSNLFTGKVEAGTTNKAMFDAGQLAGGVYIIRMTSETGEVTHHKVVLTK